MGENIMGRILQKRLSVIGTGLRTRSSQVSLHIFVCVTLHVSLPGAFLVRDCSVLTHSYSDCMVIGRS